MSSQLLTPCSRILLLLIGGIWQTANCFAADEPVVAREVPGGGRAVIARQDLQGATHIALNTHSGPQYVRSNDGGATFSAPRPIVDMHGVAKGLEFEVWDMAVGADGWVHVALGTNAWKLKLPKEQWGFFYARLAPNSDSFTPVQNINRQPSEGFSLATDGKGRVSACWLADKLYANISDDNGEHFRATQEINAEYNPCNCCTTSSTYGADGRLAVLYREETNNDRDMFVVLWDQRSGKSVKKPVSTTGWKIDACPMTYYSIIPHEKGYLAAWPTQRRIYLAKLDENGNRVTPTELKTPGMCGMRTGIQILPGPRNETLVVWNSDGKLGWQRYDAQFQPLGAPGNATTQGKGAAGVATPSQFVLFR